MINRTLKTHCVTFSLPPAISLSRALSLSLTVSLKFKNYLSKILNCICIDFFLSLSIFSSSYSLYHRFYMIHLHFSN